MEKLITGKSKELYEELKKYLVDGASSSFHKAPIEGYPICMSHGKGSKIYDVDGNEYIDYVLGFGPMIHGYCPEPINKAVEAQLKKGTQFSAPTDDLLLLSKKLTEIIPCAEMVSYQSTGTEANMHVFRLARAYTGKDKIVKFEGQYHGWSDEQKVTIGADSIEALGSRERPNKILGSKGQKKTSGDNLIIMPWNDLGALRKLFEKEADDIGAVITEPYMCDEGPIMPAEGYLEGLKELTNEFGILLIFDEVITGFRMALGGAQEYFNVVPDLSVFAKAITSGYSLSMVCGSKDIMNCGVHPSGTFNANPVAVAAAIASINELETTNAYEKFHNIGNLMVYGLKKIGKKYGIPLYAESNGSICQLQIGMERPPIDFRDFIGNADKKRYNELFLRCTEYGVRLTFARGRIYLSTAHTENDIIKTLEIMDYIFSQM